MHHMPFGQMLGLFDAALGYIIMTNPFGGGDSASTSPSSSIIRSDEPGAFNKIAGMASHARVVTIDHVSPDIRDLLDPNFSPMRQHERR